MKIRRGLRITMAAVSMAMIAAGLSMVLSVSDGYQEGKRKYQEWKEKYTAEPETDLKKEDGGNVSAEKSAQGDYLSRDVLPEDAPRPMEIDFDGLFEINSDVVGWIELPAAGISYPVVQAADNEYYLHMSFEKEALFAGSLFLDAGNDSGFADDNSIIYGHNMRDGSMFAKLQDYNDLTIYKKCPYFWIYTPDEDYLYQIYSVHKAAVETSVFLQSFSSDSAYTDWVRQMHESSEIKTLVDITSCRKSVTLSTCTSNLQERQVVQGICIAAIP